ncbi:hypothetical protein OESDEN_09113 [Oesophagostomum dentatum]|uniref:Sulfatase N-terminal domain-containing protein n=1 Tax=Oesophagostomum dentatum TaxID=61180 RepID=A0A0B1T1A8_OESDE|nr:hypothetical protein OESDEN_09113 [Oesophagostomum dentatum]
MVAHDWCVGIPYYPECMGLKRDEADHMWRPFEVRMLESKSLLRSHDQHCSERHLELLEYTEKFMNAYPGVPKAAQIFPIWLAHDSYKDIYHSDVQFLNFFKRNRHHFDNSILFFMADHGPKGEISKVRLGRYETLNPFLVVSIPKRYRNTPIHEQLRNKTHTLMTPFDLHATLMDILRYQIPAGFNDTSYRDMLPLSKGSSLFREWRGPRNCRTLPIPSQYCLCQYNRTEIKDEDVKSRVGVFLAEQLNAILARAGLSGKCRKQYYGWVLYSVESITHPEDTDSATQLKDGDVLLYEIAVYLNPSQGLFSAESRFTLMMP